MRLIFEAYSIVNFLVSNGNWKVDFFKSEFGRILIESEDFESFLEKRNSFPTFDFKKCRIYESFPEFFDLNDLFPFTG